jgi:hypothetical protein
MTSNDERLYLSAERTAAASRYDLTLQDGTASRVVGVIRQVEDDRWTWTATLDPASGMHRKGHAPTPEAAAEMQFDALCGMDPARFQRLAA